VACLVVNGCDSLCDGLGGGRRKKKQRVVAVLFFSFFAFFFLLLFFVVFWLELLCVSDPNFSSPFCV
jgi:hypothetical protein